MGGMNGGGAADSPSEEVQEGPQTTVNIADYPELKNAQKGDSISGTFTGTVADIDDQGNATITYDDLQLQGNQANASLQKMTSGNSSSSQASL